MDVIEHVARRTPATAPRTARRRTTPTATELNSHDTPPPREAVAVVWAEDDKQAEAAIDFLRHGLWPYYYRFHITAVHHLPHTGACPLKPGRPDVLAAQWRERWAWILLPPHTDLEAVIASAHD